MKTTIATAKKPRFQVQIANRIGQINGRTCAVGTDWLAVDTGPEGRHCVISHRSGDESEIRDLVACWNELERFSVHSDASANREWRRAHDINGNVI